jgi:two-component sensor histidine kinase
LLSHALNAANIVAWDWDVESDVMKLSDNANAMFGLDAPVGLGTELFDRVAPSCAAELRNSILRSLEVGDFFEHNFEFTPAANESRWIRASGSPESMHLASSNGPTSSRISGIFQDKTQSRMAEERRNLLVGEIAHRGKNLLAVVQSMAEITITDNRPVVESRGIFLDRLASLARSHSMLTHQDWEGVPFDEIVRMELAHHGEQTLFDVAPVLLSPSAAQSIALVTHELVTNAAKYGALSRRTGGVQVRSKLMQTSEGAVLRFTWQEHDGPVVKVPERTGFGSMLLRRLIQGFDTKGVIDFQPEGLFVQVDMPLEMITPNHAQLSAAVRPGC